MNGMNSMDDSTEQQDPLAGLVQPISNGASGMNGMSNGGGMMNNLKSALDKKKKKKGGHMMPNMPPKNMPMKKMPGGGMKGGMGM